MIQLKNKFKYMTHARKHISILMKSFKKDELIQNELIRELVKYHPTKKIKDEYDLMMKIRPPHNKLSLYYRNNETGGIDDISWILCIRNLYGKYNQSKEREKDIISAFRFESNYGTKWDFKKQNTYISNNKYIGHCQYCNKITNNIDVDHYPTPFKRILQNFVELYEVNLKDKKLASKWLEYHDNIAQYRILCKSCNCSFGSYSY
jgi:hypothetical protein